jgi:adenylate kinase family enzyme
MDAVAIDNRVRAIKRWLGAGAINIFGLPFSGKDTQAQALANLLDASVIAGGDTLRNHPDQLKIKRLMAKGTLFPTDFYLSVILPHLFRLDCANQPLMLSSVGRLHGEEKVVMKAAAAAGHAIKAAVFLNVAEAEIRHRHARAQKSRDRVQRYDDAEHLLDIRLSEFRAKTLPVIEEYRRLGLLVEVDGRPDKDQVTASVIAALFKLANSRPGGAEPTD